MCGFCLAIDDADVDIRRLTESIKHRGPDSTEYFTGAGVAGAQLVLVPLDGGGANPARSIGSAIFSDTDPNALGQVWLFVLVPMVAAFAAVFVWLAIDDAEIDDTVFDDTLLDDAQNALTGEVD